MQIQASELKKLLKSVAAKDEILLDSKSGMLVSVTPDLTVAVRSGNFVSRNPFTLLVDKKFQQVVARMSGDIAIHLDGAALVLKSARATVSLATKAAKPFNPPTHKDLISLPLAEIKPLLAYAVGAADVNKASPFGGVIKLKSKETTIQTAGTDGARLAIAEIPYSGAKFDLLIPTPAATVLGNLEGDTVQVAETDSYLFFQAGNVSVFANKLSKEYPAYDGFLPKSYKAKYSVDAEAFRNAILTIKPLLDGPGEPACFVQFLDNVCQISAADGSASDAADYTQLDPEPTFDPISMKIPISATNLLSFFANISGEVTLSANSSKEPIWLESGNKKMLLAVLAS